MPRIKKNDAKLNGYDVLIVIMLVLLWLIFLTPKTVNDFFHHTTLEEFELIRKYVETILSWPVIILVLAIIFFTKFADQIKLFISNVKWFKAWGVEGGQQSPKQAEIEDVPKEGKGIQQNTVSFWKERAESFEMAYLGYFIVPNSKYSLLWFYQQPEHTGNLDIFYSTYSLPFPPTTDQRVEKQNIIAALLDNGLLAPAAENHVVTQKGIEFLQYNNLLPRGE